MRATENFLRLVWPATGNKALVTIKDNSVKHLWFSNGEENEAASNAIQLASEGYDVYFAMASFNAEERKHECVQAVKSLWIDIDIGEGKNYATKSDAITALQSFLGNTGLPVPLIISSGYGLHIYWLLTNDLKYEEWKINAEKLKILCKQKGLSADIKCTADGSRIFRPIGTFNFKYGDKRKVKLLNKTGITVDEEAVFAALRPIPYDVFADIADDLPEGAEAPKPIFDQTPSADFEQILSQCATIRWAYENQNEVREPLWYDSLGVVGFCSDGVTWSHRLSKNYKEYDADATTKKLSQRVKSAGPTTCVQFRDADGSKCVGCPHTITSPIILGYPKNARINFETVRPSFSSSIVRYVNPILRVTTRGLEVKCPDKPAVGAGEGTPSWSWVYIAPHGISPLLELRLPDGASAATNHVWFDIYNESGKSIDNFVIPSQAISNNQLFSSECAKRGMYFESETAIYAYKLFHKIMRTWVAQMKARQGPIITFRSFGWTGPDDKESDKDAFLLGNTLFTKNGEFTTPLVPELATVQSDIKPRGTLAEWTKAMNNYNLPGMEPYMFASWCGWGAPLMHFTNSGSVIFHILGDTGVGKSSLQRAIISIYGDYSSRMLLDVADSTTNSIGGMMGALKNLPYLREETTERDAEQLAAWALSVTHGRERGRLSATLANAQVRTWATIAVTSANASLRETIVTQRMDSPARLARVWEQEMSLPFSQAEATALFGAMSSNYGLAGPIYVKYLVENFDLVKLQVQEAEKFFSEKLRAQGPDRFFISLLAVNYVGAKIARLLGLINHEIERGVQWAVRHFKKLRTNAASEKQLPEETLARFIQEVQPQTISVEVDDPVAARTKGVILLSENNVLRNVAQSNSITMRFAKSTSMFYATSNIMRKWYADNHLNFDSEMRQLEAAGILVERHKRMVLTKGTKQSDGKQVWCAWLDLSKAQHLIEAAEEEVE